MPVIRLLWKGARFQIASKCHLLGAISVIGKTGVYQMCYIGTQTKPVLRHNERYIFFFIYQL